MHHILQKIARSFLLSFTIILSLSAMEPRKSQTSTTTLVSRKLEKASTTTPEHIAQNFGAALANAYSDAMYRRFTQLDPTRTRALDRRPRRPLDDICDRCVGACCGCCDKEKEDSDDEPHESKCKQNCDRCGLAACCCVCTLSASTMLCCHTSSCCFYPSMFCTAASCCAISKKIISSPRTYFPKKATIPGTAIKIL